MATTFAGTVRPPRNGTSRRPAPWTRCAAVMTLPSFETTTPEPMSLTRPGRLLNTNTSSAR